MHTFADKEHTSLSGQSVHLAAVESCGDVDRFQCGDSGVQEHKFHCVGCRRSGQDPSSVEALLPEHSRSVHTDVQHSGFLFLLIVSS